MGGLPTVRVEGCNAYKLGEAVGKAAGAMIRSRAATDELLASALRPFASCAAGQRLVERLSTTNSVQYPLFWDEVRGLADGSGVPFSDLLLLNFRKELAPFLPGVAPYSNGDGDGDDADHFSHSTFPLRDDHDGDGGNGERVPAHDADGFATAEAHGLDDVSCCCDGHGKESKRVGDATLDGHCSEVMFKRDGDGDGNVINCSDVMFKRDGVGDGGGGVIAHNEDGAVGLAGHIYLVHATLPSGVSFVAYTYAGELPSCAFGFNSRGVAFTGNAVPPAPAEVAPGAVARNFLCRALLEAADLGAALDLVRAARLSAGHNLNLADLPGRRIVTVEAASRGRSHAREIGRRPFFHANMYLHLQGVRQTADESSACRQRRAAELPMGTLDDALRLLGDTYYEDFPVYMDGPRLKTLHTVVFDLGSQTMTIFDGNPSLRSVLLQMSTQL